MSKSNKNLLKKLIDSISKGKGSSAKSLVSELLASKIHSKLNEKEKDLSKTIFKKESK